MDYESVIAAGKPRKKIKFLCYLITKPTIFIVRISKMNLKKDHCLIKIVTLTGIKK